MGRALWLRGEGDAPRTERAVDLSPNFALGHYALSFVHSQSGDPQAAIGASDHSRHLSPFDPLLFGMLGARAMAHVRLGQFDEAAEWALKAAARPNAHVIILSIAAHCLALAGRLDEAETFAAAIRKTLPDYRADDFIEPSASTRMPQPCSARRQTHRAGLTRHAPPSARSTFGQRASQGMATATRLDISRAGRRPCRSRAGLR